MPTILPDPRASRASDDLAREFAARFIRVGLAGIGILIVIVGILMAPLPGPLGIPIIVIGLMLTLRNSFKARRQFVRFQQAHPKLAFPIRRLLRRDPEILLMTWQQALRIERSILPKPRRFLARVRRSLRRDRRR